MGRILGIDYGRKRTGVAVTDPLKIVAGNLATVPTHTLMQFIKDYINREPVERIVIGQPTQLNGEPSESMKYITPFVNRLKKELPDMPVVMYDERFTSTIAHQAMIDGGMKKSDRRDKARVDAIAATIILNDYLQSKYNQPDNTES
ncbi:MAG: Holliday junction resolvase RuvX [Muribaculaceae bacterium]|nr:Holliday junction resolvase RuvX [Muribaculaceae bacterium]